MIDPTPAENEGEEGDPGKNSIEEIALAVLEAIKDTGDKLVSYKKF